MEEKEKTLMIVNPETLIAQGIAKGISVEVMEKLLAMRKELKAEWAQEEYFKALADFQQACPEIKKTKIVYNKDGVTVRYRYAPIEDIVKQSKDLLKEYGFSYIIQTKQEEKLFTATCIVHHKYGHSESSSFGIPVESSQYMNAAQEVATAQTYAKKYAFSNAFGIMTGESDDDAQGMTKTKEPTGEKKKNGYHLPDEYKEDVEAMALELGTEHFEASDLQKAKEQIKKCKSLEDVRAVRQTWHLEFEKRVAAYEKMIEGAAKTLEDK